MKKIMHIVQSAGGVERYIEMLLKNIEGDYEHILVCSYDYSEEFLNSLNIKYRRISMVRELSFSKDLKSIKEVRKAIKEYKPDLIYTHSSKGGAIGRVANIGLGKTILYNPHGWAFNMRCGNLKKNIYKYIEKILALFTTKIIVISEFEKESALRNKICKEEKIELIFNGIDIDKYEREKYDFNLKRKDFNIDDDAYVIGMVGRISDQKAPDTFIEVASRVIKQIPKAFFIIVGDGDERKEIEDLIKRKKLENKVLITGWVKNSLEYINLFDLATLFSRWEGFGLAVAEYMESKKPIVASRIDAIPNLIASDCGILVEVDNVEQMTNSIMKIYNDKEFKDNIVENSYKRVKEKFDIKRVALEHKKLIDRII
ncbi:glycosyltransferase family 4 protein [Clostridium thermobutyricum]|uniref:glycosyltransferase family 4 protein n=1 Tax=Clostridium thermobutyricum TaxID=29372 RepID=UPI003F5205E7